MTNLVVSHAWGLVSQILAKTWFARHFNGLCWLFKPHLHYRMFPSSTGQCNIIKRYKHTVDLFQDHHSSVLVLWCILPAFPCLSSKLAVHLPKHWSRADFVPICSTSLNSLIDFAETLSNLNHSAPCQPQFESYRNKWDMYSMQNNMIIPLFRRLGIPLKILLRINCL